MPRVVPKKMSHVVYRTNRYDEMIRTVHQPISPVRGTFERGWDKS